MAAKNPTWNVEFCFEQVMKMFWQLGCYSVKQRRARTALKFTLVVKQEMEIEEIRILVSFYTLHTFLDQ